MANFYQYLYPHNDPKLLSCNYDFYLVSIYLYGKYYWKILISIVPTSSMNSEYILVIILSSTKHNKINFVYDSFHSNWESRALWATSIISNIRVNNNTIVLVSHCMQCRYRYRLYRYNIAIYRCHLLTIYA